MRDPSAAEGSRCLRWLPDRDECENSLEIILFSLPQPLVASQRRSPPKPPTDLKSVIEQAFEFQRLLDEGVVNSRAQIAVRYGVSRARVTQVLNLLRLSRSALQLLDELVADARVAYTERQLRPILKLPTEAAQLSAIHDLGQRAGNRAHPSAVTPCHRAEY